MIIERAPAKINLALHVRRRRPDGYHDLETLFAFARDGDTVLVAPAEEWSLTITGPFAGALGSPAEVEAVSPGLVPATAGEAFAVPDNLIEKAANAFTRVFPDIPPQAITLDKHLPVASGIGGGSADAAATLRALARIAGVASGDPRLTAMARPLGADVPACLLGRTSIGTGAGEELAVIEGRPGIPLLLVNPGVSTAAVFRAWDGVDRGALRDGNLIERALAGRNDLAGPARLLAPLIGEVEELLAAAPGAILSRMSGSGATCFALFETDADRDAAAGLAERRGWWTLTTSLA
jgi:4-diphosphocytidyl-2-C-methyl-D-erythritol kinase